MNIRELYQSMILDHNAKPRNFGELESPTHTVEGYNPLCGDQFTIYLKMVGDVVEDIGFTGSGCAISKASASLMTLAVKGQSKEKVLSLFDEFHHLVTADIHEEIDMESLGKLAVFGGVREFPARVKCASLSWHTVKTAVIADDHSTQVSTE
jgi:nitrogen fixation NifU-like protein